MAKSKVEEAAPPEEVVAPVEVAPVEVAPAVEAEVVPDPTKHVYVNLSRGHESYSLLEAPDAFSVQPDGQLVRNRRFLYVGMNLEHVDDDLATGIWRYRQM